MSSVRIPQLHSALPTLLCSAEQSKREKGAEKKMASPGRRRTKRKQAGKPETLDLSGSQVSSIHTTGGAQQEEEKFIDDHALVQQYV